MLHGGKTSFNKYQFPDLKELMDHLDVKLFSDSFADLMLQQSTDAGCRDTSDLFITKHVPRTRIHNTSKQFTDWSKNISTSLTLDLKDEPQEERIFTKVTYTKPLPVHAQNLSENLNDQNCKKLKESFVVDLSKSRKIYMEETSSDVKKIDEDRGGERILTLGNVSLEDIVVQNVATSEAEKEPITFLIDGAPGVDDQTPANVPDGSIFIQTYSPSPQKNRNRSMTHPPGEVKTEDEAKILAAPFIGKVGKPPVYKCLRDGCSYSNSRLLMTQSHVYKHLEIYTFQCDYCGLKCRLETNFEKHLNTHGLTRRKDKMDRFLLLEKAGIQQRVMMGPPHQTQQVTFPEKIENIKDDQKIILSEGKGEGDTDGNEDDTAPLVSVKKSSVIGNYQDEGAEQETAGKCYTSLEEHQYHINNKVQTLLSNVFLLIISNFRLCLLGKKRRSQ